MDVLSGFPVGHPSWGDADSLQGSRRASQGACRASRSEQSSKKNASMTVRDREKYLFCFVFYFNYKEDKIKCYPLCWDKPSHSVKVGLFREGKITKTKVG